MNQPRSSDLKDIGNTDTDNTGPCAHDNAGNSDGEYDEKSAVKVDTKDNTKSNLDNARNPDIENGDNGARNSELEAAGNSAGESAGFSTGAAEVESARNQSRRTDWSERRLIISIVLAHLWFGCVWGIFIPFFPTEAKARGASQSEISGVFSVYSLTSILTSPFVAKLIPIVGATRMFHLGLALAGTSTVAFGLLDRIPSSTWFIVSCYATRVIESLGTTSFTTASYTIVANKFPESVNLLVAAAETMSAVGIAAGPALGGELYTVGGYMLPFCTLGGVILLSMCLSCALVPAVGGDRERVNVLAITRVAGRSGEAWLNVLSTTVITFLWAGLDPELAPYVNTALGVNAATLGLYFLLACGVFAVAGPIWGKLSDHVSNTYIQMTVCLLLGGVGTALIAPAPLLHLEPRKSLVAAGLTMRELFIGGAYIPTFGNTLAACERAGLEPNLATQAYVAGVMSSAYSIGSCLGPLVAGISTDRFGFPTAASTFAVVAFVLAWVLGVQCVRKWRILCRERIVVLDVDREEERPLLRS